MFRRTVSGIMLTLLLIGMSYAILNVRPVTGWDNGGFSIDPQNPNYGTHDWIAQHALDWLPDEEKEYMLDNLAIYLYGTELPDNAGAPDGIGDIAVHHIYYWSNESIRDDASAIRAQTEYVKALNYIQSGNVTMAVKTLGIMTHYIVDVSVFGHVMGSGTDWSPEVHHSDYESYVNERTNSYDDEFNMYLVFDGSLDLASAYNAACMLAYDTTFDMDGDSTCVWMDQNYNWSNQTFKDRCGESLNLAVNLLADVLHTFACMHDWKNYHNNTEIVNTLLYLNTTYPHIVDVFSIGKSWEDRTIYCIRLTNETNTHPKPKVFFVGYHHAREPISAELPLYFAVEAATKFGTNATITHILNYSEIYIVVALNVDAFDVVKQNEWQRKNVHPFDEDEDGLLDEDPPDDADGDGYIEDLYYWDGYDYQFIRWEGLDEDNDGKYNEDWIGGVDLNRNYDFQWEGGSTNPQSEIYKGTAPFSEPETQAIRDFASEHDFTYAISFHSGAELILYPWAYSFDPPPDETRFIEISQDLSGITEGTMYMQSSNLYPSYGTWEDWTYGSRNTFAFTCEIYENDSAWRYEPGPDPYTWWEGGIFQAFNPDPSQIETVIQRWVPVFTYITDRAITEAYDITTTNVTPLKTIVAQGFSTRINVTVTNRGDFTETFNVTAYANTTEIGKQAIILTDGSSTTISFLWNTTGFAKGNYTISAYAWPVQGETDTGDNTCTSGTVTVARAGDVNADGTVDIFDIVTVGVCFGAEYGKPPPPGTQPYQPNADINGDGIIDIFDIVAIGVHFGETGP